MANMRAGTRRKEGGRMDNRLPDTGSQHSCSALRKQVGELGTVGL